MKRVQESLDWRGDRLDVDFTVTGGVIEVDYIYSHNEGENVHSRMFKTGEIDALESQLFKLI
jgi:hypothetical protein